MDLREFLLLGIFVCLIGIAIRLTQIHETIRTSTTAFQTEDE